MELNLLGLQKSTIEDYNCLIDFLNDGKADFDDDTIKINGRQLERLLRALHNNLAVVGSMIEKDGDIPYLNGEKVMMKSFDFDELTEEM